MNLLAKIFLCFYNIAINQILLYRGRYILAIFGFYKLWIYNKLNNTSPIHCYYDTTNSPLFKIAFRNHVLPLVFIPVDEFQ